MFSGIPPVFVPVVSREGATDSANIQKQYGMESRDLSEFQNEYMRNMFRLVPNSVDQTQLNHKFIGPPIFENSPIVGNGVPTTSKSDPSPGGDCLPMMNAAGPSNNGTDRNRVTESNNFVNKSTSCDVCGEILHEKNTNPHTRCKECQKYFNHITTSPPPKPTKSVEKVYPCTVCDKKFISVATLKTHAIIHSGERPFRCNMCDKTFVYEGNMKTHMRTHTGEKPFKCDQCGKSFSQSGSLKKHIRTHTGEKPFKCEYCEKTFAYSENLIPHRRTHTGFKPFQCDICKKSFSQPGSLKCHIKTMHDEKGKKNDPSLPDTDRNLLGMERNLPAMNNGLHEMNNEMDTKDDIILLE